MCVLRTASRAVIGPCYNRGVVSVLPRAVLLRGIGMALYMILRCAATQALFVSWPAANLPPSHAFVCCVCVCVGVYVCVCVCVGVYVGVCVCVLCFVFAFASASVSASASMLASACVFASVFASASASVSTSASAEQEEEGTGVPLAVLYYLGSLSRNA